MGLGTPLCGYCTSTPDMMVKLRADVGAIKFVLSGANIMAPGLTSAGAIIHEEVSSHIFAALHPVAETSLIRPGPGKLGAASSISIHFSLA